MDLEARQYRMRCACGARFTLDLIPAFADSFPPDPSDAGGRIGTCTRCAGEKAAVASDQERAQRETQSREGWEAVCPVLYRTTEEGGTTDPTLLDRIRIARPDEAGGTRDFGWRDLLADPERCSRPVLLLIGNSGAGKTRIGWRVARAAWDAEGTGCNVVAFTSWRFQTHMQDAAGRFVGGQAMEALVKARIVFIDDLGKSQWTDNTAAAFFELLECRIAHGAETVITTEMMGDQLGNWFSEARSQVLANAATGIMRRLRQFSRVTQCLQP